MIKLQKNVRMFVQFSYKVELIKLNKKKNISWQLIFQKIKIIYNFPHKYIIYYSWTKVNKKIKGDNE